MKSGTVLFCETSADDKAVDNARNYCADNEHSPEDVKIVRRASQDITLVIVR